MHIPGEKMQEHPQPAFNSEYRLRQLFELSKSLVVTLDLDDILQATVEGVTTLSGLDTAALYLIENASLRLYNTTPPLPLDFPDILRLASLEAHPHIRAAISSSAPVFIANATTEEALTSEEMTVVKMRDLCSILFLPLIAEKEVMGALIVGSIATPSPITNDQIDLAHTLANFAALAVKNSRLFEAGKRYAAELELTLIERKKAEEEQAKLREQLLQSQKMDAIGQLAGGIAHDFNNMLSGIIGNAELLSMSLENDTLRQHAQDIISIGMRSAQLTSQLLAFSRKGQLKITTVNLHRIIDDVVSILRHTVKRTIDITTRLNAKEYMTEGDAAQIQSALLNLAVNARDAMPNGGTLAISTHSVHFDITQSREISSDLKPGDFIELAMTDTGTGMDSATVSRIFEPFFTTKKVGEGTGMGLSAVYGTMKSHHGCVQVESIPGHGTTFKLYFPLLENNGDQIDQSADKNLTVSTTDVAHKPAQKILIIDDEEVVATIAARHLRSDGYEVLVFNDSIAALDFFKVSHSSISLAILDLIMPKMDGQALFEKMRTIKPDLRVILSSGYSINGVAQKLLDDGAEQFIQKPFRRSELTSAVRDVLMR